VREREFEGWAPLELLLGEWAIGRGVVEAGTRAWEVLGPARVLDEPELSSAK